MSVLSHSNLIVVYTLLVIHFLCDDICPHLFEFKCVYLSSFTSAAFGVIIPTHNQFWRRARGYDGWTYIFDDKDECCWASCHCRHDDATWTDSWFVVLWVDIIDSMCSCWSIDTFHRLYDGFRRLKLYYCWHNRPRGSDMMMPRWTNNRVVRGSSIFAKPKGAGAI